jgi:uncharacterized protein (DUF111 family)
MKIGSLAGRDFNAAPEFEECRNRAKEHEVPIKEVQAEAQAAWRSHQKASK